MDDDRRREVSLVTLAMSGLAITDRYMVTWYWDSWGRSGRDVWEKGKGKAEGNWGQRRRVSLGKRKGWFN